MPSMRKPILILLAIVAFGVTVVFGSLIWINSDSGLNWLQTRINAAIPGSMAIGGWRLSLLEPGLELNEVILHGPNGVPIAGFGHLTLTIGWRPLLDRVIYLQDVRLQSPWADLVLNESSRLNLIAALTPPGPEAPPADKGNGLPLNIVCRGFQLNDGRVSFKPADASMVVTADGIALFATGDLKDRQAGLDIDVSRIRYERSGIHPPAASLTVKARLDGDRLQVPKASMIAGSTTVDLKGAVDGLATNLEVDAMLSVKSQLADLKNSFQAAGDYRGSATARLNLEGALSNPAAQLELIVDEAQIAGQPLDRLHLSVALEDRQIRISDTALQLAGGTISLTGTADLRQAFPSGFLEPPAAVDATRYFLELIPDIPDLQPWLEPYTDTAGKLGGRIAITGRGIRPSEMSAQLTLDANGSQLLAPGMQQPVEADLHLSAQMDRNRISVDRLKAETQGLQLSGATHFGLTDGTLSGKLSLIAPDLSPALAVAGITSVDGACSAAITAGGSIDQPQVTIDLSATDLGAGAYTLGNLTLEADLDADGRLQLATLDLQNGNSRINGSGRLRPLPRRGGIDPDAQISAAFTLTSLSPADFMASPPVDGTVDGRLSVSGPLTSLQGEIRLDASSLTSQTATIGDIAARLRWDDGTLHADRLDLKNRTSTLGASGRLQLLAPGSLKVLENPSFALNAAAGHIDPGDFVDRAKGDFTLQAALSGSFDTPEGTIAVSGKQADLAGQHLESISVDGHLDQRKLWVDNLTAAVAPGERITVSGWVGMDRTMALQVRSDGVSLAHITHLQERIPGSGKLHLNATGRGLIRSPDIDGNLTISDADLGGQPIDDIDLRFALHDMQAEVQGALGFALDAACDLRQGDFQADLVFEGTETAPYFQAAGMPDLHGSLTGRINAAGNIREIGDITGQIDLDALHLLSRDISLIKANQIRMQLADGTLSIPEFETTLLKTGRMRLRGEARFDGSLDMTVDGRLPLAAAGAFNPEFSDATGVLVVNGRVSGSARDPSIDARVEFEKVATPVPGLVQKLHDLNGRILLTEDTISVQNLKGFLDTGSFSLIGTIDHERFKPTGGNLAFEAKTLPLEIPDTLWVLINGGIDLRGSAGTAEARGKIVILEGVYYKDVKINLLKLATERQRAVEPASRPLTIPFFDTVDLDIGVSHRQPFRVENNLAELEISPDLRIRGTLARPIVSGRAQVREGTVTFQKKTFEVTKGVIDFVNPYQTEAEIDIVSKTEIRDWIITLTIEGPLENLNLKLSSVPSETNSDILSLILFGKTGRELTNGGEEAKRSTGQIMAELIADTFGEDIKKRTGVDILEVEDTNAGENEGNAEGVRVTVGKHLSDRMTVKYAVESKDGEIIQRAISEYKLLENILVSGFQDSKGIYGSELVFRIEFR